MNPALPGTEMSSHHLRFLQARRPEQGQHTRHP